MAAATPAQGNGPPPTPPVNGRYRTGDDIDPMKDERSGLIREVGCQAIWSLSSCKPGFGVDQLRDQSLENYWQSDGQLPHLVNIQFRRKMTIRDICIYTDFKLDESYTPSKISIRCGTHFNDLQEVELVEFSEPSGWVQIFLKDIRDRPIRTFMLQLAVLSNHQNGRDTHLRQIRIHSPVDNLPVAVFPDVSIWLHQLVKGFRDKDGNPLPNAHLLGVFHRVCKLLNSGIKPVFVFDGGVPVLKRQTLAARRQRKLDSLDKAESSRQKILSAFLRQQLQRQYKQALPPSLRMQAKIQALSSERSPSVSPKKKSVTFASNEEKGTLKDSNEIDEDLEAFRAKLVAKLEDDIDEAETRHERTISDSDDDDTHRHQYGVDYSENFSVIQAPEFDTLPLETQHEILFEMQESKKMNSWGKFDKMPKDLPSFSNFQMDRLVKRRTLQKKIQSVQAEMGQRHIHVQNLDDLLKMDYGFTEKETKVIGSKSDGFVLIKSQEPKKGNKNVENEESSSEPKPGTSSSSKEPQVITIDDYIEDSFSDDGSIVEESKPSEGPPATDQPPKTNSISDDEDEELKLAIELSLMEAKKSNNLHVATTEELKTLNKKEECKAESKPQCQATEITDNSQMSQIQLTQLSHCAKFLDTVGFHMPSKPNIAVKNGITETKSQQVSTKKSEEVNVTELDIGALKESDSESDDDFEEVVMENDDDDDVVSSAHKTVAVVIDVDTIKNLPPDQDIFADIFANPDITENSRKSPSDKVESFVESEHKDILTENVNDERVTLKEDLETFKSEEANVSCPVMTETQWDSDSEIEADLLEMVTESTTNFHPPSSSEKSPITTPSLQQDSVASTSTSQFSASRSIISQPSKRMITAEYMQAQDQLNTELGKLQSERGFQERVATSISDQMQIETQELISLFGIPYLISPTEAESQCAFLDRACLTEGSITDDSDVWLFGGQRVYKNFFSQGQKHIEFYQGADIQRVLNLNREKLIVLALLIGSDYSDGIQGVGPVLGLEILSEFISNENDSFETLIKFHQWWEEVQNQRAEVFAGSKIKEKLRKLKLRPGFPSRPVYDAFINPTIDTSTEPFKWGNPDLDAIRTYTKQKFGWDQSKCDSMLLPVLKNRRCEAEQGRQMTLDSYITFGKLPTLENGKRKKGSKRLQTAVKKLKRVGNEECRELNLSSDSDSDDQRSSASSRRTVQKSTEGRKVKAPARKAKQPAETSNISKPKPSKLTLPKSTVSSAQPPKPEVIPQRVQEESDKKKNKQKAIEVFKKRKEKQ